LERSHRAVFTSVLDEPPRRFRLRTVQTDLDVYCRNLSSIILDELELRSDSSTMTPQSVAVLSEERILLHGGFEVNAGLIAALINGLRSELVDHLTVEAHVVLTVREQKEWLKSYFAALFDGRYLRHRTLRQLVTENLRNPRLDILSQLHYSDSLNFLRASLGNAATVTCVPMELLTHQGGAGYIRSIFHFLPADSIELAELRAAASRQEEERVNGSQVRSNLGPGDEPTRGEQPANRQAIGFTKLARLVHRGARRTSLAYASSGVARKALRPARKLLPFLYDRFRHTRWNRSMASSPKTLVLDDDLENGIDQVFSETNRRLADELDLPLTDLGYCCASKTSNPRARPANR